MQTTQERLDYLLDAYIGRRLHEPVNSKAYPLGKQPTARQTRRWLVWLAQQLQARSEDEFLIEEMQPEMLANRNQKLIYGLIAGSTYTLNIWLLMWLVTISTGLLTSYAIERLIHLLIAWPISGLVLGLTIRLNIGGSMSIDLIEGFDLSFSYFMQNYSLRRFLTGWLIFGLAGGLAIGLAFGLVLGLISGLSVGLYVGLYVGLVGLFFELVDGLKADLDSRMEPNQGVIKSAKNALLLLVFSILISILLRFSIFYILNGLLEDELILVAIFASCTLIVGLTIKMTESCIKHFSLRLVLHRINSIPWNYARFLNHCTDRLLLQRVGGRYRFIHRLVQEHFAAMPLERGRGVDE